jgi:hypothetical protein
LDYLFEGMDTKFPSGKFCISLFLILSNVLRGGINQVRLDHKGELQRLVLLSMFFLSLIMAKGIVNRSVYVAIPFILGIRALLLI